MDREIRQELKQRISAKMGANSLITVLDMLLGGKTKEDGIKGANEMQKRCDEAAEEILDLVLATVEAGKIPVKVA